jgi:superfamily I DNA/RNA helicase
LPVPVVANLPDPYVHPDAQRRIHLVSDEDELRQALDYPWDRWGVFLHPSQRAIVDRQFSGPARVSGSAGTGKTVVALHRAVSLARTDPRAKVLLTTFSEPLARELASKINVLAPESGGVVPRITVTDWSSLAAELFQLSLGRRARIAGTAVLSDLLKTSAEATRLKGFTPRFLASEFSNVVDAWGIDSEAGYASVPRLGRRRPLGSKQRERLWTVFAHVLAELKRQGLLTHAQVYRAVATHYASAAAKPFVHVVVDEAQDLGPAELLFLTAIVGTGSDDLFFAGDLGQRIFQHPYSWRSLGIDIRGRSTTLKVCYRTSRQIRAAADGLLPAAISDPDGNAEERGGTVSLFDGPPPTVKVFETVAAEVEGVSAFIGSALSDGIDAHEIGIFVRVPEALDRARAAAMAAGVAKSATVALMHLAKGLEFRTVIAMACDDDLLPYATRIAEAADESELDDIFETERQLLYVACTRARDRLMLSGAFPGSEFLRDFGS